MPYNKKERPSREWLIEKYVNQHLPISQIASELKIGETTLNRWFKDYGILKRKSSYIQLPKGFTAPTKEELYTLYITNHTPVNEIAIKLGVSWGYIQRLLKKYGIPMRTHDESIRPKNFVKPSKEQLYQWIHVENKKTKEIAEELHVSIGAIKNYMNETGVFTKKRVLNRVPNGYWTRERIVEEIKKLHTNKEDISARFCSLNRRKLFKGALSCFGSWQKAIESANIDYTKIIKQRQWTKDGILNEIRLLEKQGIDLSYKNLKQIRNDLIIASENNFKSWANAVNLAGFDYYKTIAINKNKYWTKDKTISDIKQIYSQGLDLNSQTMQKSEKRDLFDAAKEKFGSWETAIVKAGFDYLKISKLKAQTTVFKNKLLKELSKDKLIELYVNKNLSTVEIGILYDVSAGVISHFLKKNSIAVKKPKYGYKQPLVCKDGHHVKSNFERTVDDWLSYYGIYHEYEPRISNERYFKADFKIDRFYIEILGMMELPEYRAKFEEKIKHFGMKEGAGFIYCKGDEIPKYQKLFETNNNKPIVILLIPEKHKLTRETINRQLGFLIPLFSKSQAVLS